MYNGWVWVINYDKGEGYPAEGSFKLKGWGAERERACPLVVKSNSYSKRTAAAVDLCCILFCLLTKSTIQTCATTNYIQIHNNTTGNLTMFQLLPLWLGYIFVVTIEMSRCVSRSLLFWFCSADLQLHRDRNKDINRGKTHSQGPSLELDSVFLLNTWTQSETHDTVVPYLLILRQILHSSPKASQGNKN